MTALTGITTGDIYAFISQRMPAGAPVSLLEKQCLTIAPATAATLRASHLMSH